MCVEYYLVAFIILCFAFKWIAKPHNPKRLPGPSGIPLLGNALEINERNIFSKLSDYANIYGDIFGIKLLHQRFVCLSSEDIIRKVLASEPYRKYTNDRAPSFVGERFHYGSQSVFFFKDPHTSVHSGMRKGITKALHVYGQDGMNEFETKLLNELEQLNNRISQIGSSDFNPVALIQRSLTNVVSVVLNGETVSDDDEDVNMFWNYVEGFNYFLNPTVNNILTAYPFLHNTPGPFQSNYKYMVESKGKLLQRMFLKVKNAADIKGIPEQPKCLVACLLDEQRKDIEAGKDVLFTDERIQSSILELVAAGILTTWSLITNSLLCLINYPEYQDKLFKEFDENIGRNRKPTHSDKLLCPMFEAFELEMHRYVTVVPLLVGRICTRDTSVDGYDIQKGSYVIANIWRMHHNETIWGDPFTFRPERFLDVDGNLLPRDHVFRKNCMPFGVGRRQCLGEQFARSRYFMYMATLLGKWKFVGSPGKFGPCDARNMDNFETNVTIRPKPFYCTSEARY